MDIRILRDGIEIGPFTEETVQGLLQQGSITITDLAWCAGLPQWVPLANLLYASDAPPPPPGSMPPPPPPAAPSAYAEAPEPFAESEFPEETHEPATEKQKAFLMFMGIGFPQELDRENASRLVNEAMENPRDAARLNRWNKERLKLHPDLFAAEIQAAKEERAQHFFEVCETEGAPWFTKVTKAHCQVLVGFLDVHHPNWDANPDSAAESYFFPAIAEKFPQLLTKEAKGRFKYPEGPKVAKELAGRTPIAPKQRSSPVMALARGVFFGVLILGMVLFVMNVVQKGGKPGEEQAGAAGSAEAKPGEASAPATTLTPADDPAKAPAGNPLAVNSAATSNPAGNPTELTPAGSPSTMMTPEASTTTGGPDSSVPTAETLAPAAPPPAPPGTPLVLTKPVGVPGPYGVVVLKPGTRVKLVQQNGTQVTVQYAGKEVTTIPASSTNLGTDLLPASGAELAPAPAPGLVPPAPVPLPATPAPAGDSLFGPPTTPADTARMNPSARL